MKVTAIFHGVLANYIGVKRADFDLPEEALYSDLLTGIGQRFSQNLPDKLWDKDQNIFKAPILATKDERHLTSLEVNTPLKKGEEIKFFLMLAGG